MANTVLASPAAADPAPAGIMFRWRYALVGVLLIAAIVGSTWGRHIDDASVPHANFLPALNIPFQGWKTSDTAVDAADLAILQPDSVLLREYQGPNRQYVQLAVIAGHRKKSIHTPAFCMAGGGWETLSQQATILPLPGKPIPATREVMSQNGTTIVATYFFTDGSYCSSSLTSFQTVQLFKRFRSQVPMGALVRIIVPVTSTEDNANKLTNQFACATVPVVLQTLRDNQLVVH